MTGRNVLHALGFDASAAAEQYAVQTGTHPRTRTEANIVTSAVSWAAWASVTNARRSFATPTSTSTSGRSGFPQIYNAWFDPEVDKARPISE